MTAEARQVVAQGWITTAEAAEETEYTQAYCRQLAAAGRVSATKVADLWLINREDLLEYQRNVRPGRPKAVEGDGDLQGRGERRNL